MAYTISPIPTDLTLEPTTPAPGQSAYGVLFPRGNDSNGVPFGNGYLLVHSLESGMHAAVDLVRDVDTGALFVRKYARPDPLSILPNGIQYIRANEAEFTKNLAKQPRLFPTLHSSTFSNPDEVTSLVLSYCNGGNLNDAMPMSQSVQLQELLTWQVLLCVLEGLAYLNEGYLEGEWLADIMVKEWKPIIHNDMHGANIFLNWTPDQQLPHVIIGDFGLMEYEFNPDRAWAMNPGSAAVDVGELVYDLADRLRNYPLDSVSPSLRDFFNKYLMLDGGVIGSMTLKDKSKTALDLLQDVRERSVVPMRLLTAQVATELASCRPQVSDKPLLFSAPIPKTGRKKFYKPWKCVKFDTTDLSYRTFEIVD